MDHADGTEAGETTARLVLEKPLNELTEEDIAQVTREDCRRYLKDKGMRRPSWNKSQAIQQVISLKALLEAPPDPDDHPAAPVKPTPPSTTITRPCQRKEASGDPPPPPPKEPSPYRRRDPVPPPFAAAASGGREQPPPGSSCHFPKAGTPPAVAGQMTIFYGGKVNVYDGVAPDKARAILQLAATPDAHDALFGLAPLNRSHPVRFMAPCPRPGPVPGFAATSPTGKMLNHLAESAEEWRVVRETEPEGMASRKASLQRYLEKKKDRGKFNGKRVLGGSSSTMELMYLSQKFMVQNSSEQSGRADGSPTQPRPPCTPTRSSSMENRTQKLHISVDLNDDGVFTEGPTLIRDVLEGKRRKGTESEGK